MSLFRSVLGPVVAVAALAAPALGAEDPVLASLIEEALSRNPDVRAAQEAVAAARNRPAQAGSLSNPMVSVNFTNEGWRPNLGSMPDSNLAVMASQDLPFPGKRRLRSEIASRQADQTEQQLERVKLGVVARVRRAYYGLLLVRDLLELISEQEEIWKQIEGVARARYVVGQGAQQDVLRVQIEVTRIEQLRTEQEAEAEIRRAELSRLLDRPAQAPVETPARLSVAGSEGSLEETLARLEGISPELKSAAAGIERDRLAVDLARKEFKPDFSVQGGYVNRGGLDPMWQAGIGISLPAYRKRLSAGLAEAEAQRRSSERLRESVRLRRADDGPAVPRRPLVGGGGLEGRGRARLALRPRGRRRLPADPVRGVGARCEEKRRRPAARTACRACREGAERRAGSMRWRRRGGGCRDLSLRDEHGTYGDLT